MPGRRSVWSTRVGERGQPMNTDAELTVNEMLPVPQLAALGLQQMLAMYAGAVAVPLIVGGALKLPKDQIAWLISADLLCCGS